MLPATSVCTATTLCNPLSRLVKRVLQTPLESTKVEAMATPLPSTNSFTKAPASAVPEIMGCAPKLLKGEIKGAATVVSIVKFTAALAGP